MRRTNLLTNLTAFYLTSLEIWLVRWRIKWTLLFEESLLWQKEQSKMKGNIIRHCYCPSLSIMVRKTIEGINLSRNMLAVLLLPFIVVFWKYLHFCTLLTRLFPKHSAYISSLSYIWWWIFSIRIINTNFVWI